MSTPRELDDWRLSYFSPQYRETTFGELTGRDVGGWVRLAPNAIPRMLLEIRHEFDATTILLNIEEEATDGFDAPCWVLAPEDAIEEPLDPAARVRAEGGSVWARVNGEWVSPGLSECDWDELVAEYGPLTLHNLGEQA